MSGSDTEDQDLPVADQDLAGAGPSQSKSQSKVDKKWKLKNAEMRIIDVLTKQTSSNSTSSYLVIKMEFKLKNRAEENNTKVAGEYP